MGKQQPKVTLPETLEEAHKEILALREIVAEQTEANANLTLAVEAQKKAGASVGALAQFEHGGKTFMFTAKKFFVPKKDSAPVQFTHEEAAADKAICKQLVESGSGLIVEVK